VDSKAEYLQLNLARN